MCASLWLRVRCVRDHAHSSLRALYIAARFPACFSFFLFLLITLDSASFGFHAFASRLQRVCVSSAAPLRLCSSLCSACVLSPVCSALLVSALLFSLLCSVSASRSDSKTLYIGAVAVEPAATTTTRLGRLVARRLLSAQLTVSRRATLLACS